MKIDWPRYRKMELQQWLSELEEEKKAIEMEMEKQQKLREKYLLRFQIASKLEGHVSSEFYHQTLSQYQKKMEQTRIDVKKKLQDLLQQLELIEAFKKEIHKAIHSDLETLPQPEKVASPSRKKKNLKHKLPQWT